MGVYIKDTEMPKACVYRENGYLITCPLYDLDGYCGALNTEASHKENGKLSDCPLIEVPPHGRLIDADAFSAKIIEIIEAQGYDNFYTQSISVGGVLREVVHELRGMGIDGYTNAPTIIPAEPPKEE